MQRRRCGRQVNNSPHHGNLALESQARIPVRGGWGLNHSGQPWRWPWQLFFGPLRTGPGFIRHKVSVNFHHLRDTSKPVVFHMRTLLASQLPKKRKEKQNNGPRTTHHRHTPQPRANSNNLQASRAAPRTAHPSRVRQPPGASSRINSYSRPRADARQQDLVAPSEKHVQRVDNTTSDAKPESRRGCDRPRNGRADARG